ncbi:MAG: hypothetical protein Q9198_006916, partial [Flavoplaca austrocitrina]
MLAYFRHWVLGAFLIANTSVFAASVLKPDLMHTNELAESPIEPIRINKIAPRPEFERQFATIRQLSVSQPSNKDSLTAHYSYYNIHVTGSDVILGIEIGDETPLNFRSIQRLLVMAENHYTEEVARLGRDTILDGICYMSQWPPSPLPGPITVMQIQDDSQDLLAYGMVSDALRGLSQFYRANPERNGALSALIKIPRGVAPGPVELVIVG